MDRPLVSIITATYNARPFLPDLLHKVRASTYENVEHIIIDDCSTDGTREVLKELQGEFGFTLLESPVNQGPVRARNQAISTSHGKYILPWDQDNWFSPDYLATMVATAEQAGENCSPVYSHMELTGERNRRIRRPEWSLERYFRERFVDLGCLFSRKAYDAAGGIDPASFPLSDYELFFGMAVHGFVGKLVDGPRFYYGIRKESAWDKFRTPEGHERKREVARYIFDKHHDRLTTLGYDADSLRDRFIQKYYSGAALSLTSLAHLRHLAEETLKLLPEDARVVGAGQTDEVLVWAQRKVPKKRWVGFRELESTGATADCLFIPRRLNDPRAQLPKRVLLLRPGGTLIGSISNACHWRRLARAFTGEPDNDYACSPGEVRALLEKIGFSGIEIRPVTIDDGESAEERRQFIEASASLINTLGVNPQEFADRCRVTHYLVRAVRAQNASATPPPK